MFGLKLGVRGHFSQCSLRHHVLIVLLGAGDFFLLLDSLFIDADFQIAECACQGPWTH